MNTKKKILFINSFRWFSRIQITKRHIDNVTKIRVTGENTYLNVRATGIDDLFSLSDLSLTWRIFCYNASLLSPFPEPRGEARRAHQRMGRTEACWWSVQGLGWDYGGEPPAEETQEQSRKVPPVRAGEATTPQPLRGLIIAGKDSKLGCGSSSGAG